VAGLNTVTFTHGSASAAGTGPGWDTLVLEVDEGAAPEPARLDGQALLVSRWGGTRTWRVTITNTGTGAANDVRLTGVSWQGVGGAAPPTVAGRDPNAFPVPVAAAIAPGQSAGVDVTVESPDGQNARPVLVSFGANGGRARGVCAAIP